MVPVGRDVAMVRVHGWRHGIGIGADARPPPGLSEGQIRVRWSAAGRRLIEVPERLLVPGFVVRVDRCARRGSERGPARGESEAPEDLAGHLRVFDGSEQAHLCAAAGAAKRIDLEDTLQEFGPGSSPRHGAVHCARVPANRSSARMGIGAAVGIAAQGCVFVGV